MRKQVIIGVAAAVTAAAFIAGTGRTDGEDVNPAESGAQTNGRKDNVTTRSALDDEMRASREGTKNFRAEPRDLPPRNAPERDDGLAKERERAVVAATITAGTEGLRKGIATLRAEKEALRREVAALKTASLDAEKRLRESQERVKTCAQNVPISRAC